jgi:hypothetical protein
MKAYPQSSYDTAKVEASRLLTKPNIQELIAETLRGIIEREKIPLEKRILDFWVKRAFYDITEIIGLDGELKITEEDLRGKSLAVCIDSVNKKTTAQGANIEYKFANKDEAVKMLQGYIQMIKPQTQKIDIAGISDEARARLHRLLQEESEAVTPANIEGRTEAPDDDE